MSKTAEGEGEVGSLLNREPSLDLDHDLSLSQKLN